MLKCACPIYNQYCSPLLVTRATATTRMSRGEVGASHCVGPRRPLTPKRHLQEVRSSCTLGLQSKGRDIRWLRSDVASEHTDAHACPPTRQNPAFFASCDACNGMKKKRRSSSVGHEVLSPSASKNDPHRFLHAGFHPLTIDERIRSPSSSPGH